MLEMGKLPLLLVGLTTWYIWSALVRMEAPEAAPGHISMAIKSRLGAAQRLRRIMAVLLLMNDYPKKQKPDVLTPAQLSGAV